MASLDAVGSSLLAFSGLADLTSDWFAVYVMRANAAELRRLSLPLQGHASNPVWSLDGRYLLYAADSRVYRVAVEDSSQLVLSPEPGGGSPRLMPDGRTVLYAGQTKPWYWETVPLDGGTPRRPFGERRLVEAAPSPDGRLWAATEPERENGFVLLTSSGELLEEVAPEYRYVMEPEWSADGQAIAFAAEEGGTTGLFVLHRATGAIRHIGTLAYEGKFAWSPDGSAIAYVAPGNFHKELVLVGLDDSSQRTLLSINRADESGEVNSPAPAWSPDGRFLAMSTLDDYDRGFELRLFTANGDLYTVLAPPLRFDLLYDLTWQPSP